MGKRLLFLNAFLFKFVQYYSTAMGNQSNYSHGNDPTLHGRIIESQQNMAVYQDAQGEQFQKCTVLFDGSSTFDTAYQFRVNNHHSQLVDVLFAAPPQSYIGCVQPGSYQVVTERIPYRLAHFPPQNSQNALNLLQSSLRGFKDLFKVHGVMIVKDSMIGVNSKNKVKVWLNSNFSINKTEEIPISLRKLQPSCHEREIVHNIFDLISSKAQHGPIWKQFASLFEKKSIHTFDAALNAVGSFAKSKRIKIEGYMKNPFNKPGFDKKSDICTLNSEIDKLQDYKLTHLNQIDSLQLKTAFPHTPQTFQQLKTTATHTKVKFLASPQHQLNIAKPNAMIRPAQLQQNNRDPYRIVVVHSPPKQIFATDTSSLDKVKLNPQVVKRRFQLQKPNIIATNSARQSQSQTKKIEVKFNYNQKQSVVKTVPLTQSINLLGVRVQQNVQYITNPTNNRPKPLTINLQPNKCLPPRVRIETAIQTTKVQIPPEQSQKPATQQTHQTSNPQNLKKQQTPEIQTNHNEQKIPENQFPTYQETNIPIQKGLQAKSVLSQKHPMVKNAQENNNNLTLFDQNQVVNSSRQQLSEKGQIRRQIFQQQSYEIKLNQFSGSEIIQEANEKELRKIIKIEEQPSIQVGRFSKKKQGNYQIEQRKDILKQKLGMSTEDTKQFEVQKRKQEAVWSSKEITLPNSKQMIIYDSLNVKSIARSAQNETLKTYGGIRDKFPLSYRDIRKMVQDTLSKS